MIHEVTGISLNTITAGKKEIVCENRQEPGRARKPGGEPKRLEEKYPGTQGRVREIVDGSTYGSPEKVLSWTTKSLWSIQKALAEEQGIKASHMTIGSILEALGYSKQANQKMLQVGKPNPDRNAQFEFINKKAKEYIKAGGTRTLGRHQEKGEYRELQKPRTGIPQEQESPQSP